VTIRYAIVVVFLLCVASPLHAAITVAIEGPSVTAQGLTPGGGAVFFSVGHEPHNAYYSIRRTATFVPDDERKGVVAYTSAADIPRKSIWFVIDVRTGRYAVATPSEFPIRTATERRSRATKDAAGEWSRLVHERPWLELLVIRPGGDVWELTAMQGGVADPDNAGGPDFAMPVGLFHALTPATRPLQQLTPGDVVVAIDPKEIEYFLVGVD